MNELSGQSIRRLEDPRFLTGKGNFTDDINRAGQLYVQVIRSPHAHARIDGIDAVAALAVPGVLGVFDAQDLRADGVGPLPCTTKVATVEPMRIPDRFALAADRARHVGEPVAFVVAQSRLAAIDAATVVLKSGGVLAVVCYPGHPAGAAEAPAVEARMAYLAAIGWRVAKYALLGTLKPAPYLLVASKA